MPYPIYSVPLNNAFGRSIIAAGPMIGGAWIALAILGLPARQIDLDGTGRMCLGVLLPPDLPLLGNLLRCRDADLPLVERVTVTGRSWNKTFVTEPPTHAPFEGAEPRSSHWLPACFRRV